MAGSPYLLELHVWAWIIAGMFSIFSVGISLYCMWLHFMATTRHDIMKMILRILAMVPIYGIEAFISLVAFQQNFYITLLRESYEAWAVYSFVGLFNEIVLLEGKPLVLPDHVWPMGYFLKPWKSQPLFEYHVQAGVIQYVILQIITAIISFGTNLAGVYKDGLFQATAAYPYIAFVINCSQMWALYCLVMYYLSVKVILAKFRPGLKFICIKAIVFVSFWQGIAIAGFVYIGAIHAAGSYSVEGVAAGIQNLCICIEMFFAAIAHVHAFPVSEFAYAFGGHDQEIKDKNIDTERESLHRRKLRAVLSVSDAKHVIQFVFFGHLPHHGRAKGVTGTTGKIKISKQSQKELGTTIDQKVTDAE